MAKEEMVGTSKAFSAGVSPPRPDVPSGSRSDGTPRPSGLNLKVESTVQQGGAPSVSGVAQASGDEAVKQANRDLEARTREQLAAVVSVLIEQRDAALRSLAAAEENADKERAELDSEHDKFVAFLMEEQDAKLELVQKELEEAKQALTRQRALGGSASADEVPPQLADVRRLLETTYAELDEHKALVVRLEEERDQALAAVDDVRVELYTEVEGARDEAITLQGQLDELHRELEAERDKARDAAIEASTELDETRRELDERRAEVSRLRQRVDQMTEEVKHSRPPPPLVSDELAAAREENQSLRRELIETKRSLSRMTREHDALRSLRARMAAKVAGSKGTRLAKPAPADAMPPAADASAAFAPEAAAPAFEIAAADGNPSDTAAAGAPAAEAAEANVSASPQTAPNAATSAAGELAAAETSPGIGSVTDVSAAAPHAMNDAASGTEQPAAEVSNTYASQLPSVGEAATSHVVAIQAASANPEPAVQRGFPDPALASSTQPTPVEVPFPNHGAPASYAQPAVPPRPAAVGGWPPPIAPAVPYPQSVAPRSHPLVKPQSHAQEAALQPVHDAAGVQPGSAPQPPPQQAQPAAAIPFPNDRPTAVGLQPAQAGLTAPPTSETGGQD